MVEAFPRKLSSLLRLRNFCFQFSTASTRTLKLFIPHKAAHQHRTNYDMDKVYMRHSGNNDELHISFRYICPELRIDRDFNFCRKMNEKVDDALSRIRSNIEKELVKRTKKGKKKSPAQVPEELPINSEVKVEILDCKDGNRITDVTFAEILVNSLIDLRLQILDRSFQIVLNEPWVENLVLPSSIMAGFVVYPTKVEMQFAERDYSRGSWFRAKKPPSGDLQKSGDWKHCGDGFLYTTANEDVGHHLKFVLTPGNAAGERGPAVENIAKNEVQAGPGICPFETRHCFTKQSLADNELRVVSYNLLADLYADSDFSRTQLFPYCPPYALKIEYRKQLFTKEIVGYNGDIVCLQEVDIKVFELSLKPVLESLGYSGDIVQKGTCGEGIAVFYRCERFEKLKSHELNIGSNIQTLPAFEKIWKKIKSNEKLSQRICERSTTLQVTLLKCKEQNRFLLVANTHLYFHPDADHIRLLQIGLAMIYVEHIFNRTLSKHQLSREQLSIIFCGDFNSVPECGIYKLMTQGHVGEDLLDWKSNVEEAVENVSLSQPFKMRSACGTPTYTNYTQAFAACLDYIFYQADNLEVTQVIPLPTVEELRAHIAIPSVVFPSDHVALVADLKFKSI